MMPTKNTAGKTSGNVVVVHRGARDAYQVSRALSEAGFLDRLFTDLFWPSDRTWARGLASVLPACLRRMLLARSESYLPSSAVRKCSLSGLASFALDKIPQAPFAWRRRSTRWADASLGKAAGQYATRNGSALLSYSYYGYHAFSAYNGPGMLFQLHPHPASIRAILSQELEEHPDCAVSLRKEWELSLPEQDFKRLITETRMAKHWLAASSFTRKTLVENGIPEKAIDVIPYGVNSQRFVPLPSRLRRNNSNTLRLLFVGTINQRKGIKYLLEALRLLAHRPVELTVCGRVVDDLQLFKSFGSQITVRPSVSFPELLKAYQQADLFVFPSVAEGFAQVLLESLACGLPILSTTHTAAPDLIEDGIQGFVVEPRRPDLLAERIEWALRHRSELEEMRIAARERAESFTWERFRQGVVASVARFLQSQAEAAQPEERVQHV